MSEMLCVQLSSLALQWSTGRVVDFNYLMGRSYSTHLSSSDFISSDLISSELSVP